MKCNSRAVYYSIHSGHYFCAKCFMRSIENRVRATINRYKLLDPNDRVLIAISGGKDSQVLTTILTKIERKFPEVELMALTIDEGIPEYRDFGLKRSRELCAEFGIPLTTTSFKELFGYSLPEIVSLSQEKGLEFKACTFCGILRRRAMNIKAKELGATKVATGHNLDDEAQTALMNLLRGDAVRLLRLGPMPIEHFSGFIPRVKPLRYIPEKETTLYAYFKGYPLYEIECPYVRESMRDEIRSMLNELEARHPGTKYAIVRATDKLASIGLNLKIQVKSCKYCGEPTSRDVCRVCELLEAIGVTA
ncbi:MAG: TIGR00269 family protein [Candidatus Nezhaarchaeota archaeon]|nr:TIGR00269 family protein [Candidatus Nezhaarchaeota archaeon]MCX8141586.1 TIGR00269 family protein [Candidatus Nezhaarchaeota archaeon]MDW8049853.1 TIGR00269 family protein [Nitrososphaerota archaeon]